METEKMIQVMECNKCKYKWIPRVKFPKQCPKCKRMDWNKTIVKLKGGKR